MIVIEVRGVYTNRSEVFAREVLELVGYDVIYRDFALRDGKPMSSYSKCSLHTFRTWTARRCTPEEDARLLRNVPSRSDLMLRNLAADPKKLTLEAISDDELLAEVRRRGLRF